LAKLAKIQQGRKAISLGYEHRHGKKCWLEGTPGMPVPSTMSNKSSTKFAIQALLIIVPRLATVSLNSSSMLPKPEFRIKPFLQNNNS